MRAELFTCYACQRSRARTHTKNAKQVSNRCLIITSTKEKKKPVLNNKAFSLEVGVGGGKEEKGIYVENFLVSSYRAGEAHALQHVTFHVTIIQVSNTITNRNKNILGAAAAAAAVHSVSNHPYYHLPHPSS